MSQGVVISQPGKSTAVAPITQPSEFVPMLPMPQVVVPSGLPASLAYLADLSEVRIHQRMEMLKIVVGWEVNNLYTISNTQDQQFMTAEEASNCLMRQCCGPCRTFVMNISDNQGAHLIQMQRPCRCQATCCWCCWLQEMEIESPPGMPLAHVQQFWTCCIPKYKVYDTNRQCVFTILGDCCYCKLCVDVVFRVYEGDGEQDEVGQIRKHYGGCREICGMANDFTVHMPTEMDLMKKTILLATTFLIDFNYFEI